MNTLVLAGGGIDSTVCVHLLKANSSPIRLLHVDFGQKAAKQEWTAVQKIAEHYNCERNQASITNLNTFSNNTILGRNAAFIFLGLMALHKDEKSICIGIHSGTNFFDCSDSFFKQAHKIVEEYTDAQVSLIAPLLHLNKQEIISFAQYKQIPIEITYSCQEGKVPPCGVCHSCKDRRS